MPNLWESVKSNSPCHYSFGVFLLFMCSFYFPLHCPETQQWDRAYPRNRAWLIGFRLHELNECHGFRCKAACRNCGQPKAHSCCLMFRNWYWFLMLTGCHLTSDPHANSWSATHSGCAYSCMQQVNHFGHSSISIADSYTHKHKAHS